MHDPHLRSRRSLRLSAFDYGSQAGYFVTICVQDRRHLFGTIRGGEVDLNDAGRRVEGTWRELPARYPGIQIDEWIVMPNHLHGVIILGGARQTRFRLGDVVGGFKSITANIYARGVREFGWPSFRDRLWQRGYHDHVIRNDASLREIRAYIQSNPMRWQMAREG